MKKRTEWMMWAVSVGSGVIVATLVYSVVASRSTSEAQAARSLPLVVAAATLSPGMVLTDQHLHRVERSTEEIPTGGFAHPHLVFGRTVRRTIKTNAPILESSLVPAGDSPGLKDLLPPGYRALGVSVDARGNIQNHLKAGDQVDVLVTMKDENEIPSSKVLLQNVQVLAVPALPETQGGSRSSQGDTLPVVLAVTPWHAEKLTLAVDVGTLQLMLRGYEDQWPVQTSGVTLDTLLPAGGAASQSVGMIQEVVEEEMTPATYRPVEIIKGQQREHQRFRQKTVLQQPKTPQELETPQVQGEMASEQPRGDL